MTPAAVLSILVKTTGTQAAVGQMAKLDAASKAAGRSAGQLGAAQSRAQSALAATGGAAKKAAADVQRLGVAQRQAALRVEQAKIAEAAAIKKSGAESVAARRATLNLQAAELRLAQTTDQLTAASKRQASAQDSMGASAAGASPRMEKAGRAAEYVALGVAAIGVASVKSAATFEQQMNTLQSVSQATGSQMKQLSSLATKLGADVKLPGTSAQDAAEAMTEMIKAGVSIKDTMAGTRDVLVLSAAAQIDNARAAEIASNALNTFKLRGQDVKFVTDELANTANASSVEITDVADSLKMAGAVFSSFQGPVLGAKGAMHELNVAIGLLGNAGIKGSDAGTSLKQSLLQLSGPSDRAKGAMRALYVAAQDNAASQTNLTAVLRGTGKERAAAVKSLEAQAGATLKGGDIAYTAAGRMRSFHSIIGLVAQGTKKMTQEQKQNYITQIFGADAVRTVLALIKAGPKEWAKMDKAVARQGAAQDLANAKMKGFKGAVDSLKSTMQTLAITLGTPLLRPLASLVRGFASFISSIDPTVLGIAIGMIGGIAGALWLVVEAQAAWNALAAANPVGLIIVGLVALGAALVIAYKKSEAFRNVVNGAWAAIKSGAASVVPAVVGAFNAVVAAVSSAMSAVVSEVKKWDVLFWVVKHAVGLMSAFLGPALALMSGAVKAWMAVTIAGFRAAWGVVRAVFSGAWIALKGIVTGGLTAMRGVIKIIGGIFKGDFGQIWDGIKDVFRGALRVVGSILRGSIKTLTGAGKAIGEGIMDALSGALSAGWGAVRGFVQKIIDVVNSVLGFFHLPKIPDVAGGGSPSSPRGAGAGAVTKRAGTQTPKESGLARGGAFARTGGWVNQPITLMGEEAPRFPEYVIPTNPAYRGRAKMLLAQAAGTIGFAGGGVNTAVEVAKTLTNPLGSLSQAIVGGGARAGDFIRKLPNSKALPSWIRGMGGQLTSKAKDWIKSKFADLVDVGGGAGGPKGLGRFDGLPVAKWIIPILTWARKNGWGGRITSGYRSHAHNVAQGRFYHSNHEDTQYPGGAIDVGGYGAKAEGAALAAVLAGYRGPRRLVWGGPAIGDWGHFSARGNKRGGIFKAFKAGGVNGSTPISSKLSTRARSFVANLAAFTGLNPNVIAAWVFSEESGKAHPAHGDDNNWLNVGWTDSGPTSATRLFAGKSPATAARMTANWMKGGGQISKVWGKASGGIQRILKAAGQSPEAQINAIGGSGWASSGYSGQLGSTYRMIKSSSKVKTAVKNGAKGGKKPRKITKPKFKQTPMSEKWQKIWDHLPEVTFAKNLENRWLLATTTPGMTDDLQTAAQGYFNADRLVNMAAGYARAGVPGAFEWLSTAQSSRDDWLSKYTTIRDNNKDLPTTSIPSIMRGGVEAAYQAGKQSSPEDDNAWKQAIKQLADDVRIQTLRGQAIERMQPADMVIAWMHELMNGRSGTSAALAAQNPSTPSVVAGGYR